MPPVPVLPPAAWPSVDDLNAIHDVVDHMVANLASNRAPIDHKAGIRILGRSVEATGGRPAHSREIRAALATVKATGSGTIKLENFPAMIEDAGAFQMDIPAFRLAVTPVLAHETTHIRQRESRLVTNQDCDAAEAAGEAVKQQKTFAAYDAYVRHPMETAAHGVQLAVEILMGHGVITDEATFRRRAAQTWVYRHMLNHPDVKEPYEDRQDPTLALLRDVTDQARWFHSRVVAEWPPR